MTDKKTTPTTSEAELFFKALKPEQQQAMYNLYVAVSNARVTSLMQRILETLCLAVRKLCLIWE